VGVDTTLRKTVTVETTIRWPTVHPSMDPVRAHAGELAVDDILAAFADGRRVVIVTEMLGTEHEVTLRHDGETFYCDTPTTLHKHDSEDEMRQCIHEQGYASDADAESDADA